MTPLSLLKPLAEHLIGARQKKIIKFWRLRMLEALGRRPYTGFHGLDRRLLENIPNSPGFFVEAGANDGISQANTYYLERHLGWTGILIEPSPELASLAKKFRKAKVYNVALGALSDRGKTLDLFFNDLKSAVGS